MTGKYWTSVEETRISLGSYCTKTMKIYVRSNSIFK